MKFSDLKSIHRRMGITAMSADDRIEQLELRLRTITKERDALRAELDALNGQVSVGEWVMNEWPKYLRIQWAEGYEAQAGARLFNHPVPPITTSVPEGWNLYMQPTPTSVPDDAKPYMQPVPTGVPDRIEKAESGFNGICLREAQAYQKGWNDCRAAMLAAAPEAKP